MAYFKNRGIQIRGICGAVPENRIPIESFIGKFKEESVHRFMERTGIQYVHRSIEKQTASDLGYEAAEYLLKKLHIKREDIGILIFSTQSPDYIKPATACVLQKRLILPKTCASFDVNLGCSAFVYCHQLMQSMLISCDSRYGLLIVGETSSRLTDPADKSISMMFGDAGAAILYERNDCQVTHTLLMSDGARYKSIIVPSGGFRDRFPNEEYYIGPDGRKRSKYYEYMDGIEVFTFSVTDVFGSIQEYLKNSQQNIADYDYVVLHQANRQIIDRMAYKLGVMRDKVLISLDEYGNTSGVSIPITLSKVLGDKEEGIKKILVAGYGIGLSWGVTEMVINSAEVYPIIETNNYYEEGIVK